MQADNFIHVPFSSRNLDRYLVRTSILSALNQSLPQLKGIFLDVGCGKMPYKKHILSKSGVKEYIGLDIESAIEYDKEVKPDFRWNGIEMPFADKHFNCAMATEVLEHCPEPEIVLREINRVLTNDGVLFFTVPFLWNLHEVPHDEYRYTPFSLERHLRNSGFTDIKIQAMGGWHASLAQMLGLWVRRANISRISKRLLSVLFMPFIYLLIKKDRKKKVTMKEGTMITGLYGTARKI
jgi:SAM-dependent methyltransferase